MANLCFLHVSPRSALSKRAFSLIEILVVVAIVCVLGALGFATYANSIERGKQAREFAAGRTLIAAYLTAASDNDGQLMVAHYEGAIPDMGSQTSLPDGTSLGSEALHRYPYRLAPYFDYKIDGVILINDNKQHVLERFNGGLQTYGTSLCPAFGINYYFVGGYVVDGELAGADDCATRISQVDKPSSLLVFATAFQEISGERVEGRYGIEPPKYRSDLWDQNLHVDARHNGRVLCAFLDGSLRTYTVDELRDMRLWSRNAAAANDPNYTVAASGSSGVGGGGGGRR